MREKLTVVKTLMGRIGHFTNKEVSHPAAFLALVTTPDVKNVRKR
jgi:hypothetical protein